MRITVGDVVVDTDARLVRRGRDVVHLSPKAFELLLLLVECRPAAISKRDLQERLWPDTFVVEKNLTNLIAEIRKALGDTSSDPHIIRTVQRFGYALQGAAPLVDAAPMKKPNQSCAVHLEWSEGRAALCDGDHIVGRDPDASVTLSVESVSRRHALISVAGSHATLADLASKNGTSIGNTRIDKVTRLVDGDRIHVGSVLLTVRIVDPIDSTKTVSIHESAAGRTS